MRKSLKSKKYVTLGVFVFFVIFSIVVYQKKTILIPAITGEDSKTKIKTIEELAKESSKIDFVRATQPAPANTLPPETSISSPETSVANQVRETLKLEKTPNLSMFDVVTLDVPVYKQEYKNSCEESALRMVLAYYDITTTDMEVVQKVGYAPRTRNWEKNIWDDPSEMFVGDINKPSGYGAFAPALAKAARAYGREAESYSPVSAQFIAEQVYQGYPVMVWGFFRTPNYIKYSWKTDSGKEIEAYSGEHVRVVMGVVGSKDNPTGFFLNDPLTGEGKVYWSTERLMKHMNIWGNLTNQAVVVK